MAARAANATPAPSPRHTDHDAAQRFVGVGAARHRRRVAGARAAAPRGRRLGALAVAGAAAALVAAARAGAGAVLLLLLLLALCPLLCLLLAQHKVLILSGWQQGREGGRDASRAAARKVVAACSPAPPAGCGPGPHECSAAPTSSSSVSREGPGDRRSFITLRRGPTMPPQHHGPPLGRIRRQAPPGAARPQPAPENCGGDATTCARCCAFSGSAAAAWSSTAGRTSLNGLSAAARWAGQPLGSAQSGARGQCVKR